MQSNINLIVYESSWVIDRIYEVSDSIRERLTDQTLFEERCITRVGSYLKGDPTRINHKRYIERLIGEVASSVMERNRNEHAELFSTLTAEQGDQEDGDEIEFEPEDVLANVESEVIQKETIELLAENDRRKKKILESWSLGNANGSQISRSLARSLGGDETAHRRYIQRFRNACRDTLSQAI